jgi:WD40 repeat protein
MIADSEWVVRSFGRCREMQIYRTMIGVAILLCIGAQASPRNQLARPQMPPPPNATVMAVSPDGKLIAVGYGPGGFVVGNSIELISVKTGRGPGILLNYSSAAQIASPISLAFSQDSQRIAMGTLHGRIMTWDAAKTGTELLCIKAADDSDARRLASGIVALAYFADGKSLVSVDNGYIKRWDAANGNLLSKFSLGDGHWLQAVALSKDGKLGVSAHENGLSMSGMSKHPHARKRSSYPPDRESSHLPCRRMAKNSSRASMKP